MTETTLDMGGLTWRCAREAGCKEPCEHGGTWRLRMRFPSKRFQRDVGANLDAAFAVRREWRGYKARGEEPPELDPDSLTLGFGAEEVAKAKRKAGRRASTVATTVKHQKPWRSPAWRHVPAHLVTFDRVARWYEARAEEAPAMAWLELKALRELLRRLHRFHGATVDARVLAFPYEKPKPREREPLTAAELLFLVEHAPPSGARLILFLGMVGLRITEAFTLTAEPERLHLGERPWLFVPAHLCKEGADKRIPLTREETSLARKQLMARPASPGNLAFPAPKGGQWHYPGFHTRVWTKACEAAAEAWRAEHGVTRTPFDSVTPHDLRATAATMMRDRGLPREHAATRLGHADSGELLDRIYSKHDRYEALRAAMDALTAEHGGFVAGALVAASAETRTLAYATEHAGRGGD